jgi:hypothetical protein
LHGAESSVLSPETLNRMAEKENVKTVEIPETGHAPSLMVPSQVKIIQDWVHKNQPHSHS